MLQMRNSACTNSREQRANRFMEMPKSTQRPKPKSWSLVEIDVTDREPIANYLLKTPRLMETPRREILKEKVVVKRDGYPKVRREGLTNTEVKDCYRYGVLLDGGEVTDPRKCRRLPSLLNIPPAPSCNYTKAMEGKFDMWTPTLPIYYSKPGEEEVDKISLITFQLFLGSHSSIKHYKEFDLVINCDWSCNNVKENDVKIVEKNWNNNGNDKGLQTPVNSKTVIVNIGINDTPTTNISKYFDMITSMMMTNMRNGKKILVHCHMGISRSSSFVIAYLIKFKGMSVRQALEFVRSKRSIVNPNDGFLVQLQAYYDSLYK